MNALELQGLKAQLLNGSLHLETAAEDIHCGRSLLYATQWAKYVDKLDQKDKERTGGPLVSPTLLRMQRLEAYYRRNYPAHRILV